jgi:serine/threonine-protein kinase HipA
MRMAAPLPDLVLATAAHYKVKPDRARAIVREVGVAVFRWRETASSLGLSASEIERMSSAFEHEDLTRAASKFD